MLLDCLGSLPLSINVRGFVHLQKIFLDCPYRNKRELMNKAFGESSRWCTEAADKRRMNGDIDSNDNNAVTGLSAVQLLCGGVRYAPRERSLYSAVTE